MWWLVVVIAFSQMVKVLRDFGKVKKLKFHWALLVAECRNVGCDVQEGILEGPRGNFKPR